MTPVGYLETGVLYCDDNLHRLSQFPAECVDLIYLDPPFFSNRQYEVIWGDEAEVRSFEDRWEGGMQVYVNWMRERVMELHRVLKRTGTLYLHCDPTASHYLKAMADDIFGREQFQAEIVWKRTTTHSDAKRWSPDADRLLVYGKSDTFTFNPVYEADSSSYHESEYRYRDPDGRAFALGDIASPNPRPNLTYVWKDHEPPPKGWRFSRETMDKLDSEGRIHDKGPGKRPRVKRYLDEMKGTRIGSVWTDLPPVHPWSKERMGYPTQKPLTLLERVVQASSNPGDIVLDPFCGCGTAVAAAQLHGRQWLGIDISPTAVTVMRERLRRLGAPHVKLVGMPVTLAQLTALKPFEFQNWVIQRMHGTHSPRKTADMGIDGYSFMLHEPVQVKQSKHVGRPVVDGFQTAVERVGKVKGYIIGLSFTKGAYEEAARVKVEKGIELILIPVADLMADSPDVVTPESGLFGSEEPIFAPRPKDALPTVEELIASDKGLPLPETPDIAVSN